MKTDVYEQITNSIIAQLEKGAVPWLKPWKAKDSGPVRDFSRPMNAATGRAYSGINILILWAAKDERGFSGDRWLTFKQAKDLGGNVKKGEKGTQIVLMKAAHKNLTNKVTGEDESFDYMFATTFTVFNVEQCEGLPECCYPKAQPVLPVEEGAELDPLKLAWVKATGLTLQHGGDRAYYTTQGDYVQMPKPESFQSQGHYWATLFHEMTHWTGHKARLNRTFGARFGDKDYAFEELVAELGAAFLCSDHGVEGELRHAGYIESWLEVLKRDKRAIFTAASAATKAAEYLHKFSIEEEEALAA